MVMHIATRRRVAVAVFAAALAAGCGVKGPLVPAPKAVAPGASSDGTPPSTTTAPPEATGAPPGTSTDATRKP